MGLFDKFLKKPEEVKVTKSKPKAAQPVESAEAPKPKTKKPKKTAKQIATDKGEPYINIISVELDPNNIGNGAIELDWNEFFVTKLLRAGYQGRDDQQIVDQWFQDLCRNVLMENYEQWEANNPRPANGVQRKDLGDGRTEVS